MSDDPANLDPQRPAKRLVIITRDGPEHRYVTNRLCDAFDVAAVFVDVAPRKTNWRRAWKRGPLHFASKALRSVYLKLIGDSAARDRAIRRVLGAGPTGDFACPNRVQRVTSVNSSATRDAIASHRPDAILVYGTGIVADAVLATAADLAFNMHTGISPFYRGTHCAFWPVVNREPHMLGATVHECTSDVDGGRIFATGHAPIEPTDGLHDLFARCVAIGTDLYLATITDYLKGTLEGAPQDLAQGREYRGYMRTLGPELRARWLIRQGIVREAPRATSPAGPERGAASQVTVGAPPSMNGSPVPADAEPLNTVNRGDQA